MAVLSHEGRNIRGDEVNFLSSDEQTYPQLTRLYLDFDFHVVHVTHIEEKPTLLDRYLVTYRNMTAREEQVITPQFDSLVELEQYIDDHILEILQNTVFEATQADG